MWVVSVVDDVKVAPFIYPHGRIFGIPLRGNVGVVDVPVHGPFGTCNQSWGGVDCHARRVCVVKQPIVIERGRVVAWIRKPIEFSERTVKRVGQVPSVV